MPDQQGDTQRGDTGITAQPGKGQDGQTCIVLTGQPTVQHVMVLVDLLKAQPDDRALVIDLSDCTLFDTSIAWAIADKRDRMQAQGGRLQINGATDKQQLLLDSVAEALPEPEDTAPTPPHHGLTYRLDRMGRGIMGALSGFAETLNLLGIFLQRLGQAILRPRRFRLTALIAHCEAVGLQAVPIVALLSFLIGVVLAFQGASALQQFGAEIFVVDLISISILRELGILLTSIIVAGRTASAFTSAIGSMKMREEIDAMRTLGIDPAEALIVPRVLALILMLPILGLIADLSGLIGGALMAWIELGISPELFRVRLLDGTDIDHVIVGLVKAPFFALIIGIIGCRDGMRVEGTAESLGRMTSASVVAAVFAVIVTDAVFSIFFAQIGI